MVDDFLKNKRNICPSIIQHNEIVHNTLELIITYYIMNNYFRRMNTYARARMF